MKSAEAPAHWGTAYCPGDIELALSPKKSFNQDGTCSTPLTEETPSTTNRRLMSRVEEHILRAVELDVALAGVGRHWRPKAGGGLQTNDEDFQLSGKVEEIDDFLSHDWWTNWRGKFCTLLVIYNAVPASICSIMVSLIGVLVEIRNPHLLQLKWDDVVGDKTYEYSSGSRSLLAGLATYVFVLLTWQGIRSKIFKRPRTVFLDKLCINQVEPTEKEAAILGLAGFLRQSRRMVVLWSPHYFNRLWCAYELASWLHLGKDIRSGLVFMPVALGASLLILSTGCVIMTLTNLPIWGGNERVKECLMVSNFFFCLVFFVIPQHLLRGLVADLRLLPDQLAAFDIRDAGCFCCTNGHIHPESGEEMPCDRALVYGTLQNWSRSETLQHWSRSETSSTDADKDERHLDTFNSAVREKLAPQILAAFGGTRMPYWVAAVTVSMPTLLFLVCRQMHTLWAFEPVHTARALVSQSLMSLCIVPCLVKVMCLIALAPAPRRFPYAVSLLQTFLAVCMITPPLVLNFRTVQCVSIWPQVATTVAIVLWTAFLFCWH